MPCNRKSLAFTYKAVVICNGSLVAGGLSDRLAGIGVLSRGDGPCGPIEYFTSSPLYVTTAPFKKVHIDFNGILSNLRSSQRIQHVPHVQILRHKPNHDHVPSWYRHTCNIRASIESRITPHAQLASSRPRLQAPSASLPTGTAELPCEEPQMDQCLLLAAS